MSVTYGFYNSTDNDRVYNANHFNTLFNGIITEGVFSTIYEQFVVEPTDPVGKSCIVRTGKAWLGNTWTINDSLLEFSDEIDNVTTLEGRSRIDMICIKVDSETRTNNIEYVNGTEGTNPSRPKPADNQYPIAYIKVTGTDNSYVRAENITYVVGQSRENGGTPLVTGLLQQMTVDEIVAQWEALFDEWFSGVKEILDGDAAAHLQNQIDNLIRCGSTPLNENDVLESGKVYFQYV